MAEILQGDKNAKRHTGVKRSVKRSTRVDLTPMVDLGFLLVTFFVFTSAMSEPKAMKMEVPANTITENDALCESCVITLLPAENDKLYYYEGSNTHPAMRQTTYGATGLRRLLVEKKKNVQQVRGHNEMVLIIKPTPKSNMKNLVDIIDESQICVVKRYYMDVPDGVDLGMVNSMQTNTSQAQ